MQYWKCKCGKSEFYGSGMGPSPCQECPDCHTTVSQSPEGHKRAVPHEFNVHQVETDEGMKPLSRCRWCLKTKAHIEKESAKQAS